MVHAGVPYPDSEESDDDGVGLALTAEESERSATSSAARTASDGAGPRGRTCGWVTEPVERSILERGLHGRCAPATIAIRRERVGCVPTLEAVVPPTSTPAAAPMHPAPSGLFRSPYARWTAAALVVGAVVAASAALHPSPHRQMADPVSMRYSDLLAAMASHEVDSIVVQPGAALRGWLVAPAASGTREIRVEYAASEGSALVDAATRANVAVAFAPPAPDRTQIVTLVVTLLAAGVIGFVLYGQYVRQSPGGGADFDVGSGKSSGNRTTFADVAGNAAALADLREVVDFLRDSKRFVGMGAKVPKGILLEGPPGTGKTLMARALAGEAGTNFFAMSGPDFSGMFVGVGTMRVKALFRRARSAGGGVIFIDEIDSLGGRRGRAGGHPEDDRTLNQFLVELDGFSATAGSWSSPRPIAPPTSTRRSSARGASTAR